MRQLRNFLILTLWAMTAWSCNWLYDDEEDCPYAVYVKFRYDYNLQRADMFPDHVSAVRVYVYDDAGRLVTTQEERDREKLKDPNYEMLLKLPYGEFELVAVAGCPASTFSQDDPRRAKFLLNEAPQKEDFRITLTPPSTKAQTQEIATPLDTLWHGISRRPIIPSDDIFVHDTISLVRDTKVISVALRELDDPTQMDIGDYRLHIADRNLTLRWDNSVDESATVNYRPHAAWNTEDKDQSGGRIGQAEFMTSRLIYHSSAADDAVLYVFRDEERVAALNLPDLLQRLRRYADRHYSAQEFLDRGYDYQLDLFLKGGELKYCTISISVLSWTMRVQFEELE